MLLAARCFAALMLVAAATACDDGANGGAPPTDGDGSEEGAPAPSDDGAPIDVANLPIGGEISTEPRVGAVFSCGSQQGGGGAQATGDWVHNDGTWDREAKPAVSGEVDWLGEFDFDVNGGLRRITGNGLPDHPTGAFPVASSDPAYEFDRNPNSIQEQTLEVELPSAPEVATEPSCLRGEGGILLSGAWVFNGLDAEGRDAGAYEIQDSCDGHPQRSGVYHYHSVTPCLDDAGSDHSALVGYALDGFGIFGNRGQGGVPLRNAQLDACHGHTHAVTWDGETREIFHYHATPEYPYTVGCFRGTPNYDAAGTPEAGGGGAPPPPPPG